MFVVLQIVCVTYIMHVYIFYTLTHQNLNKSTHFHVVI